MRRLVGALLLAAAVTAPALAAQAQEPSGPVVDLVEISGVIDRPIERYVIEQIDEAERRRVTLLLFQVNSLGGMKIDVERLAARVERASIPVGVWVGPRGATAGGALETLMARDDVSAMTPSATLRRGDPPDLAEIDTTSGPTSVLRAEAAQRAGLVDFVAPSVADLLRRIDGRAVQTSAGTVTLRLPERETTVRFSQPGPIRRLLHAFANPALVYLCLIAGALLLVFELFQPGFGVAGWTAGLLLLAAGYGLTVIPARWYGLVLLSAGLVLLTLDVARDAIRWPTAAGTIALTTGSLLLLPGGSDATRLSPWLIGFSVAASLVFFVPAMTVVRRARRPIATEAKRALVGGRGQVRSMLNPEGFVWVADELWRARSEDGSRLRVGEAVVVARVDGSVLVVRRPDVGTN